MADLLRRPSLCAMLTGLGACGLGIRAESRPPDLGAAVFLIAVAGMLRLAWEASDAVRRVGGGAVEYLRVTTRHYAEADRAR